jgi:hypothetical protein
MNKTKKIIHYLLLKTTSFDPAMGSSPGDKQELKKCNVDGSYTCLGGTLLVAQWLRHCATNRKVAGSIPDGVIGIFH